jgi:hypothetical protein
MVNEGPDVRTGAFANGTTLLAAIPVYRSESRPREWVVVVEWVQAHGTQWVCALMERLDATSWYWGHYYSAPISALADMYIRANVINIPDENMIDLSRTNVIS